MMLLKPVLIIAIVAVVMIGVMVPSVFAEEKVVTISTNQFSYSDGDLLIISVNVLPIPKNNLISLTIWTSEQKQVYANQFNVNSDGFYKDESRIDKKWYTTDGQYTIRATVMGSENYPDAKTDFSYTQEKTAEVPTAEPAAEEAEPQLIIPYKLKSVTNSWVNDSITDYEFLQQVQIQINQGKLIIPGIDNSNPTELHPYISVPSWIKDNVGLWAEDIRDDYYFTSGIIFLFNENVLPVVITPEPTPEPTPQPEQPMPKPEPTSLSIASFVDQTKDPLHYIDRYFSEPEYKKWFDNNYPQYSLHEYVIFSRSFLIFVPDFQELF